MVAVEDELAWRALGLTNTLTGKIRYFPRLDSDFAQVRIAATSVCGPRLYHVEYGEIHAPDSVCDLIQPGRLFYRRQTGLEMAWGKEANQC